MALGTKMKNVISAVVVCAVFGLAIWTAQSVPVVQKSNRTQQIVACASEDTDWEMVSVEDHPECKDIKQAEVEWVK